MSYEIIYDKQFIKLPKNQFIPMLYWGSNNCTEWHNGRERRARDWEVFKYHCGGNFYATKEEILKSVEDFRLSKIQQNKETNERYIAEGNEGWCDTYSDKSFGYWSSIAIGGSTRNTTFGRYKGLFTTGMKKALTVEELREEGIRVNVYSNCYGDKYGDLKLYSEFPTNGEELIKCINEAEETFKNAEGVYVSVKLCGASETNMKWLRRKLFPKKTKQDEPTDSVQIEGFWTYKAPNGGYFHKFTARGYRYSYQSAKYKFLTEDEANKALSKDRRERGITVEFSNDRAYLSLTAKQIATLDKERIISRSYRLESEPSLT